MMSKSPRNIGSARQRIRWRPQALTAALSFPRPSHESCRGLARLRPQRRQNQHHEPLSHRCSSNDTPLSTDIWTPSALGQVGDLGSCRGWAPKPEQLEQVVAGADHQPLPVHLFQSPQQELPEAPALFHLPEHRFHRLHPQCVALSPPFRPQLPPHPVPGRRMPSSRPPPWRRPRLRWRASGC